MAATVPAAENQRRHPFKDNTSEGPRVDSSLEGEHSVGRCRPLGLVRGQDCPHLRRLHRRVCPTSGTQIHPAGWRQSLSVLGHTQRANALGKYSSLRRYRARGYSTTVQRLHQEGPGCMLQQCVGKPEGDSSLANVLGCGEKDTRCRQSPTR